MSFTVSYKFYFWLLVFPTVGRNCRSRAASVYPVGHAPPGAGAEPSGAAPSPLRPRRRRGAAEPGPAVPLCGGGAGGPGERNGDGPAAGGDARARQGALRHRRPPPGAAGARGCRGGRGVPVIVFWSDVY